MTQKPEKDPNDKYAKYDFGVRCNEHHDEDEFDPEKDAVSMIGTIVTETNC